MTHFVTAVIVPKEVYNKGEPDTLAFIDKLMEPYSESYEVEPYISKEKSEVEEEYSEWKKELQRKIEANEKLEDYYTEYICSVNRIIKPMSTREWAKSWSGDNMDNEGNVITTWNEKSFWDWYVVGGRWNGLITEMKDLKDENFGHDSIENNSILIEVVLAKLKTKELENAKGKEVIQDIINDMKSPFGSFGFADILREFFGKERNTTLEAKEKELYEKIEKRYIEQLEKYEIWNPFVIHKIMDSNGKLYEGKSYGWFGMSSDKETPDEWLKTYTKLLEENKDNYIVTLDCHV